MEEAVGGRKGMTGGLGLSAGERGEGGERVAGWAAAQEGEKRPRGNWAKRPKEEGGRERFHFLSSKYFFKLIFQMKIEFKTLYKFHTSHK